MQLGNLNITVLNTQRNLELHTYIPHPLLKRDFLKPKCIYDLSKIGSLQQKMTFLQIHTTMNAHVPQLLPNYFVMSQN